MLRPKIFPTLWKTWVAYGLPHGFVRHDKILPIQPPNLKKRLFQQNRFFSRCQLCHVFLPARSHSQPLAATRSHSSGRKWLQVAAPREWPQVAASGRSKRVAASGRKWSQVAAPDSSQQVAASGRSQRVAASGRKWPLSVISISTLKATSLLYYIHFTHTHSHICIYTYVYIHTYIYIYIYGVIM